MEDQLRDAFREDMRQRWKEKLGKIEDEKHPKRIKMWRRMMWPIAAGLALLLGLCTWFWLQPTVLSQNEIAQAYFAPLPNVLNPAVRGETTEKDVLALAMRQYEAGAYDKAISLFESLNEAIANSEEVQLYMGVSYIAMGQFSKAIVSLQNGQTPAARWYLALAYLQNGMEEKGLVELDRLQAGTDTNYQRMAADLARDIRR